MLVSIIIPAYNREKLIVEALTSVVSQSWRPVEVVVVDDGSSDQTAAVAENFASGNDDPGVSLKVLRGPNRGSTAARNAGIGEARGECLLFLDSDDILDQDGLATLANALMRDAGLDFAYGKVLIGDENLVETGESVGRDAGDLLQDPVTYHWHTMAALYRSTLVAACGGWDETADGSDDWVFQARIKLAARQARFIDVTLGIWRQHEGERLGATRFRESYTVDVTKSCLAIHRQWAAAGRLTLGIQRRLYLRALRHCWEIGSFGSSKEREAAFLRVREIGRDSAALGLLTLILRIIPRACDRFLHGVISKNKAG